MARAYGELAREGFVEQRERVGTFATAKAGRMSRRARVGRVMKLADGLVREARALGLSRREVVRIVEIEIGEIWD